MRNELNKSNGVNPSGRVSSSGDIWKTHAVNLFSGEVRFAVSMILLFVYFQLRWKQSGSAPDVELFCGLPAGYALQVFIEKLILFMPIMVLLTVGWIYYECAVRRESSRARQASPSALS